MIIVTGPTTAMYLGHTGHYGVFFVLLLVLGSLAVMAGVVWNGRRAQRRSTRPVPARSDERGES